MVGTLAPLTLKNGKSSEQNVKKHNEDTVLAPISGVKKVEEKENIIPKSNTFTPTPPESPRTGPKSPRVVHLKESQANVRS